jgi:hypothetical protein
VSDLPAFDAKNTTDNSNSTIPFRRNRNPANDYYPTAFVQTSESNQDYSEQKNDSYLEPISQPRTIAGNALNEVIPLVQQNNGDSSSRVIIKNRAPFRPAPPPPTKRDDSGDSYV